MPPRKTPAKTLDLIGIDTISQHIADGMTLRQIAAQYDVHVARLADWLSADTVRTSRARESRQLVAQAADYQAEAVLSELQPDATQAQVARARELASHYRWRAKACAPRDYGDKQQVEHSGPEGGPMTINVTFPDKKC